LTHYPHGGKQQSLRAHPRPARSRLALFVQPDLSGANWLCLAQSARLPGGVAGKLGLFGAYTITCFPSITSAQIGFVCTPGPRRRLRQFGRGGVNWLCLAHFVRGGPRRQTKLALFGRIGRRGDSLGQLALFVQPAPSAGKLGLFGAIASRRRPARTAAGELALFVQPASGWAGGDWLCFPGALLDGQYTIISSPSATYAQIGFVCTITPGGGPASWPGANWLCLAHFARRGQRHQAKIGFVWQNRPSRCGSLPNPQSAIRNPKSASERLALFCIIGRPAGSLFPNPQCCHPGLGSGAEVCNRGIGFVSRSCPPQAGGGRPYGSRPAADLSPVRNPQSKIRNFAGPRPAQRYAISCQELGILAATRMSL
jgi:hypothetical protein